MRHYHINSGGTNLTSNQIAGVTTTPINAVPGITTPFYMVLDATNINGKYEEVEVTGKTATNVNHAATAYAHTTAEEVRFPFVKTESDEFSAKLNGATAIPGVAGGDGWQSVTDTWTYASASTITVPTGAASLYQVGDKIKCTNTTVKYFVITSVADTVLTVAVNTDYVVANAAITSIYYSHQSNPVGYPGWFNWTPVLSSAAGTAPTYTTTFSNRFSIQGRTLNFRCTWDNAAGGTAGSGTNLLSFTLPVADANYVTDRGRIGMMQSSESAGTISYFIIGHNDSNINTRCFTSANADWIANDQSSTSRQVYAFGSYEI